MNHTFSPCGIASQTECAMAQQGRLAYGPHCTVFAVMLIALALVGIRWPAPVMGASLKTQPNSNDQIEYMAGCSALRGHHYREAAKLFRKAASAGNARAMWHLGALYRRGWGVRLNYQEMKVWWERSSKAGDATARGTTYANAKAALEDYQASSGFWSLLLRLWP